jgi:hypothetical protein
MKHKEARPHVLSFRATDEEAEVIRAFAKGIKSPLSDVLRGLSLASISMTGRGYGRQA